MKENPAFCEEIAALVMENKDQLKKGAAKAAPKKLGAASVNITAEVDEEE